MQEDQITPLYQDLATLEEMPAEAAAWSAMQDKNKDCLLYTSPSPRD